MWKASSAAITCTISCAPEEFASWAPVNAPPLAGTLKQSYRRLQRWFPKPHLPNWKHKHTFLRNWHPEISCMTFMSFIIIPGKKNASALGTSGVLFLTKMGCLFCFNNWKSSSFQAIVTIFSVALSLVSLVSTVIKQWQVNHGSIKSIAIPNPKQLTELSLPPQKL